MVKFSDLCRKDCPWLERNENVTDPLEVYEAHKCHAFDSSLNHGDEHIDPYKCKECKEVTKKNNRKVSIDSLVHTTSIMTHNLNILSKNFEIVSNELGMLKALFVDVNENMRKSKLRSLIDNDPKGGR